MPRGFSHPSEAKLGEAKKLLSDDDREAVTAWWLVHRKGASTPNWDIASTATIDGALCWLRQKLTPWELSRDGKADDRDETDEEARRRHAENTARIDLACRGAGASLNRILPGWNLSIASHYQLCNRFAWAWKLASLGVPVVLVYLGFLHADEMRDQGDPRSDAQDWRTLMRNHAVGIVPASIWDEPILIGCTPLHALIRSTELTLDVGCTAQTA